MKLKVYEYLGCGTCKKALKHLDSKKVNYEKIPIRDRPPKKSELKKMLQIYDGNINRLFNTSGKDYRELNVKEKIKKLSQSQLLDLLAKNGNLIKRPFIISGNKGVIGFKEDEWKIFLNK